VRHDEYLPSLKSDLSHLAQLAAGSR